MIVVLQILLVAVVLGFVLAPLLRHRGEPMWIEPEMEARRRSITERKARLYGALLELDFDRDSGKISNEDHARMREEIMSDVVTVIAEEEREIPRPHRRPVVVEGGDRVERMIEEFKRSRRGKAEVNRS
jgi:cytochrome c-type biogenesis protein CcmI